MAFGAYSAAVTMVLTNCLVITYLVFYFGRKDELNGSDFVFLNNY